ESGFDEVSLFDLDSESGEERPARRRRSRRGRRSGGASRDSADADAAGAEARGERERGRGRSRRGRGRRSAASRGDAADSADSGSPGAGDASEAGDAQAAEEDSLDEVMQLSPDAPEILDPGDYDRLSTLGEDADADADAGGDEPESEIERMRSERARRRSARAEEGGGLPQDGEEPEPDAASELPRGRVAILAHADRQSIIAGVLLAREVRQLEGIWIYPQSELMTFFRSVATDLPGRTPIYVVGFAAKPAREALQAAALYQGRLAWFDHHEWPPEDLEAMRQAIGAPLAHLHPGTHSSLPAALAFCTWRSRLSSKLVDLVTGAFTQHDFEKWGHLWWSRLGEMSRQPGGPRRDELAPLLTGRPSELTEAAERAPAPPLPEEAAWAAQRDFRLVRFGGLGMVVAEVPEALDLHMAMRIAREPHGARISLARMEGEEIFVLAADEAAGQGRVETAAMALHLSQKFDWVEALPDADRVTRFRARGVVEQPGRLEELIAEIGMGRAILEG
ncbi:MAG: hypothetical protein OXU92_01740, partial [Deltaproteobacteria bacterium]|nr:hypothetical protein [Deltaproteobacteria bacterium]